MSQQERPIQTEQEPGLWAGVLGGVAAQAVPSAVGAMLRATRQRYGWDLEEVERSLRIRHVHLQAIEDGRFEDLPGPAYAIGFVRAYADHLGLEREEVVAQFREEISDLPRRTQLNFPTPIPESRVPSGAILLISLAIALAAYGGWYYLTMGHRGGLEAVVEVPRQLADMFKPKTEETGVPATEAAASTVTPEATATMPASGPAPELAAPNAGRPAPDSANTESAPGAVDAGSAEHKSNGEPSLSEQFGQLPTIAPEAGGDKSTGSVFGQSNTNARIVIRANGDSWVQVRNGDGELILTRMLRSGDSYRVPNKTGLTLLTGNAGALEVYVDGRKVAPLGPGGAIRRDVALDADKLLAGTALDN
jgi:cytoskeleton protein RodZ